MEELFIYFACISIVTERLVEFTKGFTPLLNTKYANPKHEELRRIALMALASAFGVAITLLSHSFSNQLLPQGWDTPLALVAIGLLASGGSGGWNRFLKISEQTKNTSPTGTT